MSLRDVNGNVIASEAKQSHKKNDEIAALLRSSQ
jgi:hypothetical protein